MNIKLDAPPAAVDPNALHYQEILFSLVMSVVAALGRDNPLVRSPDILWAFAGMLAFNLSYHRLLRSRGGTAAPLVSLRRGWSVPGLLLPGGVLGAPALGGLRIPHQVRRAGIIRGRHGPAFFEERAQRLDLSGIRARMDALARSLERRTANDLQAMKKQSLEALVPGISHALNNPLGIILGSVELMLQDAPKDSLRRQDLERIRAAARRCAQIGGDLQAYSQAQEARSR